MNRESYDYYPHQVMWVVVSWTMSTTILAVSLCALLFFLPRLKFRLNDPYGLFHLTLNRLPSDDQPKTEWLNMGYWAVGFSSYG